MPQGKSDPVDDQLKSCSSWVQQAYRMLETCCLRASMDVRWRDSSKGIGRLFYVGSSRGAFCRLDPKKEYIGIGFCNAIRDHVTALGILRKNRSDMSWASVDRSHDLEPIAKLIKLAAESRGSKRARRLGLPAMKSQHTLTAMGAFANLQKHGFVRIATLSWTGNGGDFRFDDPTDRRNVSNLIYAWVDRTSDRILNVGHTGQSFQMRFGDYIKWLNGKRRNDSDTPIRHKWLACLRDCQSGQVEVWIKSSAADQATREAEERKWISQLHPILNRRM